MRSRPIGYCIYCGTDAETLSDEHVVPYSLGGSAKVPEASCSECSTITSRFELQIARPQLGAYRVRSDLPTRRPGKRPKKLPLPLVGHDGKTRTVEVDPDEHPGTLFLPDLPEPRELLSDLDGPRRKFRMFLAFPDTGVFELAGMYDAAMVGVASFEIGAWYLLLAKIAHAGAYFMSGRWTHLWEPLLPDLIRGRTDDYDRFIGGTSAQEFSPDDGTFPVFYRTVAADEEVYLVAIFRLFAHNKTPTYQVVVGRRKEAVSESVLRALDPDSLEALALDPDLVVKALRELDKNRAHGGDDA